MLSTRIAGPNDLGALKQPWSELVLQMEYPVVFMTWEWVVTWWEHFGGHGRELVILVVSEGDTVKGILPLYREWALFRNYWLNGRILCVCSGPDLYPDHLDLIAAPADAGDCLRSIVRHLRTEYRDWDVLQLPLVASSSQILRTLQAGAARADDLQFDVQAVTVAYFIAIHGTFEEFLGRLDAKQRYNLRSRAKKLFEKQGVQFVFAPGDEESVLRRLFALHRQRASSKGIVTAMNDPRVYAFHHALAARIRDRGWLSLRELRGPDGVIAGSYNFDFAGRVLSYQKGFDPAWERFGPGSVLLYELIREAFATGKVEYNFLQGDETYKSVWTQDFRTLSNVTAYNDSWLGRVASRGHRVKRSVKRRLRRLEPVVPVSPYAVEMHGAEALGTLGPEWAALVESMRYPTVFASREWIHAWWDCFGAGRKLRLITIRRDGRLKGILPLFSEIHLARRHGRLGRVLEYASASDLYPDPLDIVSAPGDAPGCVKAAFDFLRHEWKEWDVGHFRYLAGDGDLMPGIVDAVQGGRRAVELAGAPYIPISGSYEDYIGGLSTNERTKVRRARRRLIEGEGAIYRDLGSDDPLHALARLFDLHRRRAEEKKIQSAFAHAGAMEFHRSLLTRLDPRSVWLRGLQRGDEIVAVFYGYAIAGRLSYYQMGYDPAWGAFSPGAVLLQETIREAFEHGFCEYNFLQGDEQFKHRWTKHSRRLYSVDVFNHSALGRLSSWVTGARLRLRPAGPAPAAP